LTRGIFFKLKKIKKPQGDTWQHL